MQEAAGDQQTVLPLSEGTSSVRRWSDGKVLLIADVEVKPLLIGYLRDSGSDEGSEAERRDRKEWKISSLHRRDLETEETLSM